MARASNSQLDALHGLTANLLAAELKRAGEAAAQPRTILVKIKDKDGGISHEQEQPNPAYAPIPPQLLDKALKFLKDNGIDSPGRDNAAVSNLADALADLDLDDVAGAGSLQ